MLTGQSQRLALGPIGLYSHGVGKKRRAAFWATNRSQFSAPLPSKSSVGNRNAATSIVSKRLASNKHAIRAIPDGSAADAQPHEALNMGDECPTSSPLEQTSERGCEEESRCEPQPGRPEGAAQVMGHLCIANPMGDGDDAAGRMADQNLAPVKDPHPRDAQDEVGHPEILFGHIF